jgi:glycyl-tRNA synthetase beta chain
MPDFLLEIGTEEIPARMIDGASAELSKRVGDLLTRERLSPGNITALDTPRRLAVLAADVAVAQPDMTEQLTGPSVSVAFKDGVPAPAAHAFAKKAGTDVSKLERVTTAKGEYLAATVTRKGRSAREILAEALPREIAGLYWPKNMYWRKRGELFVRPVRWLVAMLDDQVIPLEFGGIRAGKISRGHRILADRGVEITRAGSAYVTALEQARVLSREAREHQIRKALDAATRTIPGARWREDKDLLATVVNLTEYPSVILGRFDREFLELPEEVLVTVMRDHQKYFAVEDESGKLLPHFLAVLNTDGDPAGLIRHGNERVLRARFNDARFFWQTDQKHPLRERFEMLKHVTFQKDLGSYYDKTLRVQRLASWLCEVIRETGTAVRPGIVHKAGALAKTDLTTELVKEFPELQGIVGGLYARVQELDRDMSPEVQELISIAIYDHYKPGSMEDSVPRTVEGAVLSIADKADSIAGMFALGLVPSGSKDPFALRRQANGIVKTIAEKGLTINLARLMDDARAGFKGSEAEKKFKGGDYPATVQSFLRERVEFYLREACGLAYDVVNAVLAAGAFDVLDAKARGEAIARMRGNPDFESVCAAFIRIRGILEQARDKQLHIAGGFVLRESDPPEQVNLAMQAEQARHQFEQLRARKDYVGALTRLSGLRPHIDAFFDKVMVMVPEDSVRSNRLALLDKLRGEFSSIADFSEIVIEGKTT